MPQTRRATSAYAAHTLSLLSLLATVTSAHAHHPSLFSHNSMKRSSPVYQGCFSSSNGLSDQGSYTYQTPSYCQPICTGQNQAVMAQSGGSNCWCGAVLPPASSKVDDSNCNTPCNGFGSIMCGGTGFYSVYLTGLEASVPNAGGSSSESSSAAGSSSTTSAGSSTSTTPPSSSTTESSSTTTSASVVTSVAPGQTVVVTQPASNSGSSTASPSASSHSGGSTNVAGVAAGVVVGVIAAAAIVAGLVFWLRHKRRQANEDEYKRSTQVSDFMRGGRELKPPPTAYSNMSDSRLDPEAGRRDSQGSIADNNDYSRKILRVANPDNS